MARSKTRKINERFYDAYQDFDYVLCEYLGVKEDGVQVYRNRMKEAVLEAREVIPEWDSINLRLEAIRNRYQVLKQGTEHFDDFQGKDEDVVWMQVFCERLDAQADPLAKYAKMDFKYKRRSRGFWQKVVDMFR